MSTSKHKNAKTYRYSFRFNGVRFHGPTGCETKAKADKFEAKVRAELEAGNAPTRRKPDMTLDACVGRFWLEKGQFEKSHATTWTQLKHLNEGLGPHTIIARIDANALTKYQSAERTRRGVGDRTISAEVPELLSRVFRRARLWGVALPEVDWASLRLRRSAPRVRELAESEEQALFRELRRDYHPIVRFALATGLRKSALLVRRDQVDFEAGVLRYDRKSKHTGNQGFLPLTRRMAVILRRAIRVGKDPDYVFTYVCARSRGDRRAGQRYPITGAGLREAVEPAVRAAGLKDWRTIHDLRHTAATRVLRNSRNLKAVQGMLGHSDIAQTARYAHALMDDIKAAMES